MPKFIKLSCGYFAVGRIIAIVEAPVDLPETIKSTVSTTDGNDWDVNETPDEIIALINAA